MLTLALIWLMVGLWEEKRMSDQSSSKLVEEQAGRRYGERNELEKLT
jgi:hypothetical protein